MRSTHSGGPGDGEKYKMAHVQAAVSREFGGQGGDKRDLRQTWRWTRGAAHLQLQRSPRQAPPSLKDAAQETYRSSLPFATTCATTSAARAKCATDEARRQDIGRSPPATRQPTACPSPPAQGLHRGSNRLCLAARGPPPTQGTHNGSNRLCLAACGPPPTQGTHNGSNRICWPPAGRRPPSGPATEPIGRPPEGLGGGFAPILAFVGRFLGAFAPIWGHDLPLKTKKTSLADRPRSEITRCSQKDRPRIGRLSAVLRELQAETWPRMSLTFLG